MSRNFKLLAFEVGAEDFDYFFARHVVGRAAGALVIVEAADQPSARLEQLCRQGCVFRAPAGVVCGETCVLERPCKPRRPGSN